MWVEQTAFDYRYRASYISRNCPILNLDATTLEKMQALISAEAECEHYGVKTT